LGEDFDFTPEEIAEVVKYGLCGKNDGNRNLPKTTNNCRITVECAVQALKNRNFPILVIDEFNPTDFTWPTGRDYTTKELADDVMKQYFRKKFDEAFGKHLEEKASGISAFVVPSECFVPFLFQREPVKDDDEKETVSQPDYQLVWRFPTIST
jgi:hypothetical protein